MDYKIYNNDGELVNTIHADEEFVKNYCGVYGFTYELASKPELSPGDAEPTQLDRIEAQVAYTAMMTNTLLEV